jgi:Domain of unknown function (DUF305)
MAQAVLERTGEPEVRQLANSIIASQKAEVWNMKAMVEKEVGNWAQVELEPANGTQTTGTATLSEDPLLSCRRHRDGSPGKANGKSRCPSR